MSASADIQRRLDHFVETCRRRGLKVTHQRMEIYREVVSSTAHPDAETVHRGVRRRIPTISLDTVYRNLKTLADEGLITIVGLSHERLRFEANIGTHHHFVCERCGRIQDFSCEEFDAIALPRSASRLGRAKSVQVSAVGVCRACLAAPGR